MDERALFTEFWENEVEDDAQGDRAHSGRLRLSSRSEVAHGERNRVADRLRREDDHRRARDRQSRMESAAGAGHDEGDARHLREAERGYRPPAGKRFPRPAGTARSSSSAVSDRRRRWRGASSSTSSTTAGRSRPTCARWDRPCRRFTGRAATSRSVAHRQISTCTPSSTTRSGGSRKNVVARTALRAMSTNSRSRHIAMPGRPRHDERLAPQEVGHVVLVQLQALLARTRERLGHVGILHESVPDDDVEHPLAERADRRPAGPPARAAPVAWSPSA